MSYKGKRATVEISVGELDADRRHRLAALLLDCGYALYINHDEDILGLEISPDDITFYSVKYGEDQ
jgi:hypothetical protein